MQAGNLRPGEALVTLNVGSSGIVVWVRVTPGVADRYNLTVAQDHTYAVGAGLWVVHNTCGGSGGPQSYEERVKLAAGDTTVGEPNSHQWNGSQPVTDVNGNPVDRGWAGPDAVKGYGTPDETWIEAKSNVQPGGDLFANNTVDRNFRQLATYERYGRPFEYWLDAQPSELSVQVIRDAGGGVVIFP